jgi:hypothetical protein
MKRLSLFLFFIFVFLANKAATLSGKITDTKGEALPFAIVFVK